MNSIRQIRELNKRELEAGVTPEGSWHADYRDTAYVYIGGLPFELSEGDIVTIFSQYGEPVYINLVRDKETGKSKGFAFLKYEDQRSTDLAVDNLGGAEVMGRILRVDHTRYKKKDDEDLRDNTMGDVVMKDQSDIDESEEEEEKRPLLKEERELAELMRDHDEEDPMKAYLIEQKKEEVQKALKKLPKAKSKSKGEKKDSQKRHHHRHRSDHRRRGESRSPERNARKNIGNGRDKSRDRDRDRRPRRSHTPDERTRRCRSPSRDEESDSRRRRHHRSDSWSPERRRRRSSSPERRPRR